MHANKTLMLALAAAGLAGSADAPLAGPDSVFVSELALIDGGVCRSPAAGGMPLLRVAQAAPDTPRRKDVGPAAPAAAKAVSGPAQDADPPLFSGLGTRSLKITTSSKLAQLYFDQGYRLAWGFNHDEALRAFGKAQRLDPECAMCFWGEAWALGPNINVPMDAKANAPALAAVERARSLAGHASVREKALIGAIASRYSAGENDRAKLDASYGRAMRKIARTYTADAEIATLYADALMNISPWDYWEAGGKQLRPPLAELVPTLERVLAKDPEHAAAIHLYIHAVEASDNPRRAERYADKLAQLAPEAGHLVHMPAHIYFVVGRYKDSLATNLKAVKIDETYIAAQKPAGVYPLGYYTHNVHFLMVSAQMGGDGKTVVASAEKLGGLIPAETAREVLMLQPVKAAPYFAHAQFSSTPTVLALADPGSDFPYIQTAWRYARGIALTSSGDLTGASRELAEMERIAARADYKAFEVWKIPAKDVGQIAAHVLRARIAQSRNDLEGAVSEIQAAIRIQDSLPYMEPAYWYYPVRQSLGALLLAKGDAKGARQAFGEALARTPNNAWALYGLAEAYSRDGMKREARAVSERFSRAWMGDKGAVDLARL